MVFISVRIFIKIASLIDDDGLNPLEVPFYFTITLAAWSSTLSQLYREHSGICLIDIARNVFIVFRVKTEKLLYILRLLAKQDWVITLRTVS